MAGIHIIVALFALSPAAIVTQAAAGEPGTVEALLERGKQARDQGQLDESLRAFEAAAAAAPNDTDALLYFGTALAQAQRFDAARETLTRATRLDEHRPDLQKALARSELWAGRHAVARQAADVAVTLDRNDVDARLLSAQVALAQQDLLRAAADLNAARSLASRDPAVITALADLKLAENRPVEAIQLLDDADRSGTLTPSLREKRERLRQDAWRWRYAFNVSYSDFSTANREEWREAFQQLAWRASDDTELQARLETSERFGSTDNFLALGVARRLTSRVQGYVQLGGTPHAQFRERQSILGGTAIRFDHSWSGLETTVATLDVRLNEYASGHVETYLPGIEQYFGDGRWWLSARGIYTNDELGRWQDGWMLRGDLAISDRLNVFAGYADAPEYSGNATLDSRSPFGGLSIAFSDACTANVSYAREDRPGVYVRTAWTAGASCKL